MKINIATVLNSEERTNLYFSGEDFKFHVNKNNVDAFQSKTYHDVFCWLGFTATSRAIFQTDNFKNRYRVVLKKSGDVIYGTINNDPIFYFQRGDSWSWTNDIYYIESNVHSEIIKDAKIALGINFIDQCNSFLKDMDHIDIKENSTYHALS